MEHVVRVNRLLDSLQPRQVRAPVRLLAVFTEGRARKRGRQQTGTYNVLLRSKELNVLDVARISTESLVRERLGDNVVDPR